MSKLCILVCLLLSSFFCFSQDQKIIDSLEKQLNMPSIDDTSQVNTIVLLARELYASDPPKATQYIDSGLLLSQKANFKHGEARLLYYQGMIAYYGGTSDKSINYFLKSLSISEATNDAEMIGANLSRIGNINREEGNYAKAGQLITQSIIILRKTPNKAFLISALNFKGLLHLYQKEYAKATANLEESFSLAKEIKDNRLISVCLYYLAEVYLKQKDYAKAKIYYQQCVALNAKINNQLLLASALNNIGGLYISTNKVDSAIIYSQKALVIAKKTNQPHQIRYSYDNLCKSYQIKAKIDSAFKYQSLWIAVNESLFNVQKNKQINLLQQNAQEEKQNIEIEKHKIEIEQRNLLLYAFTAVIIFILIIIFMLYRNNISKNRVNINLQQQKDEITLQKHKIQEQHTEMLTQNEELHQQKEALVITNEHLEEKNALIESQNEELEKVNQQLKEREEKISEQNAELASKQVKMIAQNDKIFRSQKEMEALKNDLEDIVSQRTNELRQTLDDLTKRNQDLSQFSFIISHNIRSPIARILGLINIFNENNYDDIFNKEIITHLKKTTTDLDIVIKDLTQIISIRNDLNKTREEIDILEVIELEKFLLQDEIQRTNATIEIDISKVNTLFSIKSYLQSIIHNLLSNAIKYKSNKRNPIVRIKIEPQDDFVCLSVQDNGLGLDLAHTDTYKIFGLYQRMHDHVEGKGLGLFLVKTQIESLGGKIEIHSTLDVGTTFKVYFPIV